VLIRIKRKKLALRATLEPRVRALLGDRLRAYYAASQHLPLPDSLAAVIEELAQKQSLAKRQGE
jgi:anti-sigma factor NepR-like protein